MKHIKHNLILLAFTMSLLVLMHPFKAQAAVNAVDPDSITVKAGSSTSLTITWDKVSKASGYRVYRRTPGGKFSLLSSTTKTTFTNRGLKPGSSYFYSIQAYRFHNGKLELSEYSDKGVRGVTPLSAPVLKSATSGNYHTVKISFTPVDNASGYYILRKTGSGKYQQIAMVEDGDASSYQDTTAVPGTPYTYNVKAYCIYAGIRYAGYQKNKGLSIATRPSRVYLSDITNDSLSSITISWDTSKGASGYLIYRKTASEKEFIKIETITDPVTQTYTDTSVVPGEIYTYTVKAYADNGTTTYSYYDTKGLTITLAPKQPELPTVAPASDTSISLSFSPVDHATGYGIYRRSATEDWKLIDQITQQTSYTDSSVVTGRVYYYSIRSYIEANSKKYWSTYDQTGSSCFTKPSAPLLSKVSSYNYTTLKISWEPAQNASGYLIYRKDETGDWQLLDTITDSTTSLYYDKTAVCGATYFYTIASYVCPDGENVTGDYDTNGLSGKAVPSTPILLSTQYTDSTTAMVEWKGVAGADSYKIYRKVLGGSWKLLSTMTDITALTDLTYYDKTATAGTTYYYSVSACHTDESGNAVWGSKNSSGRWVRGALGIDVSKWQYTIDWQKIADQGVEFAIIKVLGGTTADRYYSANILGAQAVGIKVGVYTYDTASTDEAAVTEANRTLELISNYTLDLPVFFDYEEKTVITSSKTKNTNRVSAFCDVISAAGYETGVYSSASIFKNKLNYQDLADQYQIWVANYHSNNNDYTSSYKTWSSGKDGYDFGSVYMWQFTSNGKFDGINARVDRNVMFTCQ